MNLNAIISPMKKFIKNNNNTKLAVEISIPESNIPLPLIILLCGFCTVKEELHITGLSEHLYNKNFATATFDVRGFGESEGNSEESFTYSDYIDDLHTIIKYITPRFNIDSKRINLWGHSIGGAVALLYTSQKQNINSVSTISSPISIHDIQFSTPIKKWVQTGYFTKEKPNIGKIKIGYSFIEDAEKYDLKKSLAKIKVPVQVGWGTEDLRIPCNSTKHLYEAITSKKESFELQIGHAYKKDPREIALVNEKVSTFFLKVN
jgi:alpha-beta hydrolase superfamily lysophospholipase